MIPQAVLALKTIAIIINTPATKNMSCRTKNTNAATACIRNANVKSRMNGKTAHVSARTAFNTPVWTMTVA